MTAWLDAELPALREAGATVVASIWGRTVEEFGRAADLLAAGPEVVAVEVNVSRPNSGPQPSSPTIRRQAAAVAATAGCGRPCWASSAPTPTGWSRC
ncbi:MAG: hypothetical protein R2749_19530 [Acidimicrobiales bacterium]